MKTKVEGNCIMQEIEDDDVLMAMARIRYGKQNAYNTYRKLQFHPSSSERYRAVIEYTILKEAIARGIKEEDIEEMVRSLEECEDKE